MTSTANAAARDLSSGARNILSVYYAAGPVETDYGMTWYTTAHMIARALANAHAGQTDPVHGRGVTLEAVAAVLSALSPSNAWATNVRDADKMLSVFMAGGKLADFTVSTYNANKRKAWAILTGALTPAEAFGKNTSLKTRAFWRNILDPHSACAHVVVDGHAYGIWLGERRPLAKTPKLSPKLYQTVADAYAEAARAVGVAPSQMQAVTWVTWRNLHNVGELSPQYDLFGERPGKSSAPTLPVAA